MCGICGYMGLLADDDLLRRMTGAIVHRGPDDAGELRTEDMGLGIRRLSIIDVAGGHQPIFNEDDSLAIVFNGEIYNYSELSSRCTARGHRFRTKSDTETVLHLYEDHGTDCVQYLQGMFAFAIYDRRRGSLFIARDRLGIKPLYYWNQAGKLVFASEIKAILECDDVPREPCLEAIDAYLALRYVPGPTTMFSGIRKLPAGHWLLFQDGRVHLEEYWRPCFSSGQYKSDEYYQEAFTDLFAATVKLHLVSDVPVGAFLSGGLDSSAIVATMTRFSSRPVQTFSVGFDWAGDELPAARTVARNLGCDHHEVVCRFADIALLPKIVWHLDEPIGDAIVLPMYLLSQMAQRHVKVVLTGEGADETLAGYLFHKVMYWNERMRRMGRLGVRAGARFLARRVPLGVLNKAFSYPAEMGERGRQKLVDYLDFAARRQPEGEHRFLISLLDDRDKAHLYDGRLQEFLRPASEGGWRGVGTGEESYLNTVLELGYRDWLPDNILMKADKTSMANSIEGRVPFMDHRLVEFLFQVPPHLKLRGWREKILLRTYIAGVLPAWVARQRKRAFYIPLDRYFTTPAFQDLVDTCLSERSTRRRGYFAWSAVERLLKRAPDGDFLFGKQVLSLLMLELWHRIFIDREAGWAP